MIPFSTAQDDSPDASSGRMGPAHCVFTITDLALTHMNRSAPVRHRKPSVATTVLRCITAFLVCGLWPATAPAQQVVTLDDAVRLAVASKPRPRFLETRGGSALMRGSRKPGDRRFRTSISGTVHARAQEARLLPPGFRNPGSGVVTPIEIGSDHAVDLGFNANQILFNAHGLHRCRAASTYSRGAREVFRAKEAETVASARKAFYAVLVAREVKDLVRQTLTNAEENFKTARVPV